jgi:myo-inositol catabolism protein IolC
MTDPNLMCVLAFDHRTTFRTLVSDTVTIRRGTPSDLVAACKSIVYDGYVFALEHGLVPRESTSVIIDEECGAALARAAERAGHVFGMPVERTQEKVFQFEYGENWRGHIEEFRASFYKGLVRWSPDATELNVQQIERLVDLSRYLRETGRCFLLELLVPPDQRTSELSGFDPIVYDIEDRPASTVRAIEQLHAFDITPDIWKLEGVSRVHECEAIGKAAMSHPAKPMSYCVVLGRSAPVKEVQRWLSVSAGVPGYGGFAIGRSVFIDPLSDWLKGTETAEGAAARVGRSFANFVDFYTECRQAATPGALL